VKYTCKKDLHNNIFCANIQVQFNKGKYASLKYRRRLYSKARHQLPRQCGAGAENAAKAIQQIR
jgi:hypothetical protein